MVEKDMSSEYTGIIGVGTSEDGNAQFEAPRIGLVALDALGTASDCQRGNC